jgi:hypothetical protein
MLLWIAIGIALIYSFIKPYCDGLLDTSVWLSKITFPSDMAEIKEAGQLLKIRQAALMDGWPSNIVLLPSILGISAIIVGFFYSWWGGLIMFLILAFGGGTSKFFIKLDVSYFITLLLHRLSNRIADYKMKNDFERAEVAEELSGEVQSVLAVYLGSGIKSPSNRQIKSNPYGDVDYLIRLHT